jgi:hypothetical protein
MNHLTPAGLKLCILLFATTAWADGSIRLSTIRLQNSVNPLIASPSNSKKNTTHPATVANPTTSADKKGTTPPEYKRPSRWGLTAGGSQRKDWLSGKNRYELHETINARTWLDMPEWLDGSLEQRTRYETFDTPWQKGQKGGQHQTPLQTVLWLEAHHNGYRAGFEFWDARQFGAEPIYPLNNTMVNVANFAQMYAAWSGQNVAGSGMGIEARGGRYTLDLGSRRLVARNVFRNTTNSFTGIHLRLREDNGNFQIQAFANQPVLRLPTDKTQLLNNDWAWDQESSGAFFTGAIAETAALPWDIRSEVYLYYLSEDNNSPLNRQLFTPGLRLYRTAKKGEFDFEAETIGQTGSARPALNTITQDVAAYFEHAQAGYTFDLPWDPRLLLQYDYASGGKSADGNTSHSFDTLYGARRWEYGPTGIFGAFARNNINSPGTRLFVIPHRDLSAFLGYRAWWMADSKAPWIPASLSDPSGQSGDFMGQTLEISARWDAHDNVALEAGWTGLIKGDFARNAPGAPANHDTVNYFYVQSELRI